MHIFYQNVLGCTTNKAVNIDKSKDTVASRLMTPNNFKKINYNKNRCEHFVQNLKLKEDGSKIYLYNNQAKQNQSNHSAIIDYDVGKQNSQQCADAIIKIRAEYLFQTKQYEN